METLVAGPSNLTAPIGVVPIQARLAPTGTTEADWTVLECHLVFGRPRAGATVMDAWTHVAADAEWDNVVCLGVSLGPILNGKELVSANPGLQQFSVAVAGAVNIACDRELLAAALPGDILYWEKEAADIGYIAAPTGHRSAKIRCAPPRDEATYTNAKEYARTRFAQSSLAHDPIALAFLTDPSQTNMTLDKARGIVKNTGGRIGKLLALGPEGTNECRVLLDL